MLLEGKRAAIFNVANKRSIAWAIAQACAREGAELVLGYQNERLGEKVRELVPELPREPVLVPMDVATDEGVEAAVEQVRARAGELDVLVHSLAFAPSEALERPYVETSREAFRTALEVSAYSLALLARAFRPLLRPGASLLALTYYGSEKVMPNYNLMGVAKAALESSVRYLAYDLGADGIRVNAISAGPLNTLSARGISGFTGILQIYRDRAALKRNIEHREVADTAVFLASPLASGITGEVVFVDAGYSIMGA
ncbi:enoyl-ACP reductase FabI [Limnochorda pilosa]|uniref:Enoyl-[acyl-carrier-protein] reductase [NADH] n=1 Tax=Limnochorda pilosa TaxID=1555112 RepID=A0A0K2SI73_LIMPI|nr:enoyl-ACP reductase [Limnochorda pilosa]BAS26544.1 enoyl-ACP reductase [Limnochorda pilosa]